MSIILAFALFCNSLLFSQMFPFPGNPPAASGVTPIALVAHTLIVYPSTTTPAIDTTGSSLLIAGVSDYNLDSAVITVTDSKSNTWTPLSSYGPSNTEHVQLFYAVNPTVGSGHTFTFNVFPSTDFAANFVATFSNVTLTSPLDQQTGNGAGATNTIQPGSITPGSNNELIISGVISLSTSTPTIDSGFSTTDAIAYNPGTSMGGGMAYFVQSSAAAVNPTWSGNATAYAAAIASFKHQ